MVVVRLLVLLAGLVAVLTTSLAASAPAALPPSKAPHYLIIISMVGGCPDSVDSGVEQVSGLDVTESDYVALPTSADFGDFARCEFTSGGHLVADPTTDVKQATIGETAKEYLTSAISGFGYHVAQLRVIPGLGDAAEFGVVRTAMGLEVA